MPCTYIAVVYMLRAYLPQLVQTHTTSKAFILLSTVRVVACLMFFIITNVRTQNACVATSLLHLAVLSCNDMHSVAILV